MAEARARLHAALEAAEAARKELEVRLEARERLAQLEQRPQLTLIQGGKAAR
jgi:hypothetical protein